ncbi:MAG: hypothetical protein C7B46_13115 [Sulfobacillus benefaciens]|uniref:PucR C-terminal helix-turn-helix domain-containing protein n=1 Tax=Sulfobacillus benefaciens TaxID=453960 RepID=A0A2T2XDX0_9FIRM|nr:MAG: hypothetical protein C7B46_13115 [Sulfobacillus benefaciens]
MEQAAINVLQERNTTVDSDATKRLLEELHGLMINLYSVLGHSPVTLHDAQGVLVLSVPNEKRDLILPHSIELKLTEINLGTLRTTLPISSLVSDAVKVLILKLSLTLSEISKWSITECERRSLAIDQLLADGLTPQVHRLLSAEGIPRHLPSTLVGLSLIPQDRLLCSVQEIREFVVPRIWKYQSVFPCVWCRPNIVLGLIPNEKISTVIEWSQALVHDFWIKKGVKLLSTVSPVENVGTLPMGIANVSSALRRAEEWGMEGVILPNSRNVMEYLQHVDRKGVAEFTKDVLGPLLVEENQELLETLKVYLREGRSVTKSARILHIHRNTVLYRIGQAERLLGFQLKNIDDATSLWVALRGHELYLKNSL